MANFTPQGIIKIGRVPFDNSYKHTMTFASAEAQRDYFQSICDRNLDGSTYTYIRTNNTIRVPFNAEQLYTYNYVMYQNANYGNKWFYAFIIGVNYLNENATELVLELDVMQTWYFDYELVEGFVEREHVADDTIGAHLNPEPEMPFDLVVKDRYSDGSFSDCYAIVQTNAVPNLEIIGSLISGANAVVGGWYNHVFNGAKYYAYDVEDGGHGDPDGIFHFLEELNADGAAESISNIFMFPKALCPPRGSDKGLAEDTNAISYEVTTSRPNSLGNNYIPNNNKLFTFPYCYCMVDDNNGHKAEYRYEYWDGYRLSVQSSLDPTATVIVAPQNYNGIANNVTEAFNFPYSVKCSWNYSSYQTWVAQNHVTNALSSVGSVAMMAVPAAKGIGAAVKEISRGLSLANRGLRKSTAALGGVHAASTSLSTADKLSMGAGAAGLGSLASDWSRNAKIPDTVRGSASGNTLFSNDYLTYNVAQMVIREEYARIIDGFFDMFGYQVDSVKIPNRTGRQNWNYVKMQNSCHRGNVPADDMALINSIYNAGITFWHTPDIGNYSLPNK